MQTRKHALAAALIILGAYLLWKPVTLFLVPGILAGYFLPRGKPGMVVFCAIPGISLCAWIALFWTLHYFPISLIHLYYAVLWITLAFLLIFSRPFRLPTEHLFTWQTAGILGIGGLATILRFLPMFQVIVPSGADMSMHAYITELIIMARGIPSTYLPLVNIDTFDTFPVGFHTISAMIALLGNVPGYQGAFVLTCITYVLLTGALALLVYQYTTPTIALITTLWISFFLVRPQGTVGWGGNPTILAIVFVLFSLVALLNLTTYRSLQVVLAALFLSGVFLTHTIIFVQAGYILSAAFIVHMLVAKKFAKPYILALLSVIVVFGVCVTPYMLAGFRYQLVTEPIIAWLRNWIQEQEHSWYGSFRDCYWSIPRYIAGYLLSKDWRGIVTILGTLIGWGNLAKRDHVTCALWTTFALMAGLLILNSQYWTLPFSYAIYPERVALMMIAPISIFGANALACLRPRLHRFAGTSPHAFRAMTVGFWLLFTGACVWYNATQYLEIVATYSSVTQDDVNGLLWLKEHTTPSDIIATNYGDAGVWIPALIRRQVTSPHVNVVYFDRYSPATSTGYVFFGSRCVYPPDCRADTDLLADDAYRNVFQSHNTYIFQHVNNP